MGNQLFYYQLFNTMCLLAFKKNLRSTGLFRFLLDVQYENDFTFGELDYMLRLDRGGTAAVTRRLDGRHFQLKRFSGFSEVTELTLDRNQLDNFNNDFFAFTYSY